jgi:hypothetical protein
MVFISATIKDNVDDEPTERGKEQVGAGWGVGSLSLQYMLI